jgi:murein L,D-transpeptidase YcbB/YkuD
MYRRLAATLARYRALSEQDGFAPLPRVRKLVDGEPYAGIAALHRRLVRFDDLPGDTPEPARYEGAIVDAVKRFQARHGLLSDGIVGKATLAALDVPPRRRVRQIELAMERMRWLPEWTEGRSILVNIPEFRLRGYELDTGAEVLVMKVIVGQALETETPIFQGQMRHVEFKPYWNVPRSIARDEIVPKLRLDPGYLAEQDMELVSTRRPMAVTTVVNAANLDAVLRGELRIRQRPGPKNALGDIKFAFPNESSIYLHHTSSPRLFQRGRRDFSHGCVRVEDPVGLARFLLADRPDWTEQRILEAMQEESPPQTVRLSAPVPVLLFYTTVVVEDGQRVLFLPDIYRHDEALELALETNRRGR